MDKFANRLAARRALVSKHLTKPFVTKPSVKIVSFYMKNINDEVLTYQRLVFEKYGVKHRQILTGLSHGKAMDKYMKETSADYVIFFDIDAVPLKPGVVQYVLPHIDDNNTLLGIAQRCNTRKLDFIYAGPSFLGLSKKLYDKLGQPSFEPKGDFDVGGRLSWEASKAGFNIKLLWPSHVMRPRWYLDEGIQFGIGTTYEDLVYHHFEIRRNWIDFVGKCKEILLHG